MEIERKNLEMSRVLNMIEDRGWEEMARSVEGESLSVSVVKKVEGLDPRERRMCLDDLATIVKVFGWELKVSGFGEEGAFATLVKVLPVEEATGDGE